MRWPHALLLFATLLAASAANAQRVAVGGMHGPRDVRGAIIGLQRALKSEGFEIQSTKGFISAARKRGVLRDIPTDAAALVDVSGQLAVDAVIYVELMSPNRTEWPSARRDDRVVDAIAYSGHDGGVVAQVTVNARRGRLTREIWQRTAAGLAGGLHRATAPPPPQPVPIREPPRRRRAPIQARPEPKQTPETIGGGDDPTLIVHAGLSFRTRSYTWTAAEGSPVFQGGGVEYDSALVPGIGLEGEVYPFRSASGLARGIGFGLQFDKVFLDTEQKEVASSDGEAQSALSTTHQQLRLRLLYEHALRPGADAIRLRGLIGMSWLSFEISGADDYRGASYQLFELGVGALIPLGGPLFNLEAQAAYVPTADLGDTVEEVGESATASGFNMQGGLLIKLPRGLTARANLEYQSFAIQPSGPGRQGRIGDTAEDSYLGFRLQGGYRF